MTTATIHVDRLNEALGNGFSFQDWFDDNAADLTTEHADSSYGQPVLVRDGRAYGPADLAGITLNLSATSTDTAPLIAPARAAGWAVKVHAWCDYCGDPLTSPETRKPGDRHEGCR